MQEWHPTPSGMPVTFTLSGHSSGGSMASAHAIAFSDRVAGLGHFQAAPYGCSRLINKSVEDYNDNCTGAIASEAMYEYAKYSFSRGRIADLGNLWTTPVFVYAGEWDTVVHPAVGEAAAAFYTKLSCNVTSVMLPTAEHAFAVESPCVDCNPCSYLGPPYINNCNFDLAGRMLSHLYSHLLPRVASHQANFHVVDQKALPHPAQYCRHTTLNPHCSALPRTLHPNRVRFHTLSP